MRGSFSRFLLAIFVFFPIVSFALTPQQQFNEFATELNQYYALPMRATTQGIQRLSRVSFVDPSQMGFAAARFFPGQHALQLSKDLFNPANGHLKSVAQAGGGDSSIVVHELWHSFYWGGWRSGANPAFVQFSNSARALYSGKYSPGVIEEIHEEAFGLFIQEVVRSFLFAKRMLKQMPPEAVAKLRVDPRFIHAYESAFTDNTYGYYSNWSGVTYSTVPITLADKRLALREFFDGKLSGSFAVDFP